MKPGNTSAPKTKVVLTWTIMLIFSIAMFAFWIWWVGHRRSGQGASPEPGLAYSVVLIFFGVFLVAVGIAAYVVTLFTNIFTFNFKAPVWAAFKVKLYFANIFVPLAAPLGIGFILSAFIGPLLSNAGISAGFANIIPVMGTLFIFQIAQMWILIWAPVEKRLIAKRLAVLGIAPHQLANAFLVGLSNPQRSSFKRFGAIEEDVGAMWVGPEQLIYYGDGEQFGLTRSQITQIERKADSGSTSMLAGIAHIVLHVAQADGSIRQIRLHNEGLLTMGQKRVAMEQLAEAITRWHGATTSNVSP